MNLLTTLTTTDVQQRAPASQSCPWAPTSSMAPICR